MFETKEKLKPPQNLGEPSECHIQLMFRPEPFATLELLGETADADFAQPSVMSVDVIDAWVGLCIWADRGEWLAWFHASGLGDRYEIITQEYDPEGLFKTGKELARMRLMYPGGV